MIVVYIGEEFYRKSGTMMSSVYQIVNDELMRTDFGFIQIALRDGDEVRIRQATDKELVWAYSRLEKYLKE